MSDNPHDHSHHLDDEFAAFVDRLLSGDVSGSQEMLAQDQEFRYLQETAERLHRTMESVQPDRAMAERIRDNLVAEWRESNLGERATSFWKRWLEGDFGPSHAPIGGRRPGYALAMGAAIVLLGLLVSVLAPESDVQITGTAGVPGNIVWLILLLGVLVLGGVWWFTRSRR